MALARQRIPVLAPEPETAAIRALDSRLARTPPREAALVGPDGGRSPLPASVYELLTQVVHELARGNAVTVVPIESELTTQQAADLLNVSRPFFVKLLESGQIPFHSVGSHRRVATADVLAYRQRRSRARRGVLRELAEEAQDLGVYG